MSKDLDIESMKQFRKHMRNCFPRIEFKYKYTFGGDLNVYIKSAPIKPIWSDNISEKYQFSPLYLQSLSAKITSERTEAVVWRLVCKEVNEFFHEDHIKYIYFGESVSNPFQLV